MGAQNQAPEHRITFSNPFKAKKSIRREPKTSRVLMHFFFNIHRIVNKSLCLRPNGQSICLAGGSWTLQTSVIGVRPKIKNNLVLHRDNAPCHTLFSINNFLASKNVPVALQPPLSPDLSP